jgi:hypothetical protein
MSERLNDSRAAVEGTFIERFNFLFNPCQWRYYFVIGGILT